VADFRQADATGKSFETRYYSADIHKAALVLPPFMEQALS
jgi:spermidine synthase